MSDISRSPKTSKLLALVRAGGLHSLESFAAHGIGARTVRRALAGDKPLIKEFVRGVYMEAPEDADDDMVDVTNGMIEATLSIIAPDGAVCLGNAAYLHEISDESPSEVLYAVDRKRVGVSHFPRLDPALHPYKLVFWPPEALRIGIQTMTLSGVPVRVTDPARTVVDLLRYRGKLGEEAGLKALKDYLRGGGDVLRMQEYAEALGVGDDLRPFMITGGELQEAMARRP